MAEQYLLRKTDMVQSANITTPQTNSPILSVEVPRGQAWLLKHNEPLEMVICTRDIETPNNTGLFTFTLTEDTMDIPHLQDSDIIAVWDTVAQTYLNITAVDYDAGEVTVSDATDGDECRIFYPIRSGTLQIAIIAPLGLGGVRLPLLNRSIQTIHGVDQYLSTSPLKIPEAPRAVGGVFGGWIVPETYTLQVLLDSSVEVTTDPLAVNYHMNIPYNHTTWAAMPPGTSRHVLNQMITLGR